MEPKRKTILFTFVFFILNIVIQLICFDLLEILLLNFNHPAHWTVLGHLVLAYYWISASFLLVIKIFLTSIASSLHLVIRCFISLFSQMELSRRGSASNQVGFPPLFICMVALICNVIGYVLRHWRTVCVVPGKVWRVEGRKWWGLQKKCKGISYLCR